MSKKGFSIIEIIIVLSIISTIAAVAIPMYMNYLGNARAAEVPTNLKAIVEAQLVYRENPLNGDFTDDIADLDFQTNKGTVAAGFADGEFFKYSVSATEDCTPAVGAPVGTAEAIPYNFLYFQGKWHGVCMGVDLVLENL